MEKVKIEDSKLAGYIHDVLINRGYKIAAFNVNKNTEHYDLINFAVDIDSDTYIDVNVDEISSISAGDRYNGLQYSYSLNHVCDDFPSILKLRAGDQLEVVNDPRDNESSLKILFTRRGDHSDIVECEVDRDMIKNLIDEILIELEVKDFIE